MFSTIEKIHTKYTFRCPFMFLEDAAATVLGRHVTKYIRNDLPKLLLALIPALLD